MPACPLEPRALGLGVNRMDVVRSDREPGEVEPYERAGNGAFVPLEGGLLPAENAARTSSSNQYGRCDSPNFLQIEPVPGLRLQHER